MQLKPYLSTEMIKASNSSIKHQKGFSMFEVLITLVITSIGILGLGAIQLVSMKNVNSSNYRSLATMYAYDMAERMRSNKTQITSYDGINGLPASKPGCNPCSAVQQARVDAYDWNDMIQGGAANNLAQGGLPNGIGSVNRVGATDFYDVTIQWDEQENDDTGGSVDTKTFTLRVRIQGS